MKLAIVLAVPLLAALSQPVLAAEPGSGNAAALPERAVLPSPVRAEDLRRVAEAIVLDDTRAPRDDRRQAIETIKARVKAVHQSHRSSNEADCTDCPDTTDGRPPHSASEARKIDCIHCTDRPARA